MKLIGIVLAIIGSFFIASMFIGVAYRSVQEGQGILSRLTTTISSVKFSQLIPTPVPSLTVSPTPKSLLPPLLPAERGIKVPVLLYHYISENLNKDDKVRTGLSTPPHVFEQQLQLLSSHGFTPITFDELAAAFSGNFSLPDKPVILTFDDGYADFYLNAAPLLQKYRMKGVSFIPTGLVGGSNYMTWSQIEELSKSPYVVFGAHSVHHYYLAKNSAKVVKREVEESKRVLEEHVGYRINWFAYPYGAFDDQVIRIAKSAEFIGAVTTIPGSMQYQSRFFYILRYRAGMRLGNDFLKLVS